MIRTYDLNKSGKKITNEMFLGKQILRLHGFIVSNNEILDFILQIFCFYWITRIIMNEL